MLRWMSLTRWVRWGVLSILGVCLSLLIQWGLGNIGHAQENQHHTFIQSAKEAYDAQRYTDANEQLQQAIDGYVTMG